MSAEPSAAGRAAARLARQLDAVLADLDLSLPQYRLLAHLTLGESRPSTLAPKLGVTRPTITALVDGMVARGLVQRLPDPDDRRRVRHLVTPAGRRALVAADRAIEARLTQLASHLPAPEAAAALEGLALWNRAIDAVHAAEPTRGER